MASHSHLPKDFFNDVFEIQVKAHDLVAEPLFPHRSSQIEKDEETSSDWSLGSVADSDVETQLRLLRSVRELEERLATARAALNRAMKKRHSTPIHVDLPNAPAADEGSQKKPVLSKEDYKGLVDLYYYSQRNRFSPDGPDYSPSLLFTNDYEAELSKLEKTRSHENKPHAIKAEDGIPMPSGTEDLYENPLKEIEKVLLRNQTREIRIMQAFVDLLLDDNSSNRDLYNAYKQFPYPGVSWLPKGLQRLFLQRMATPWKRSRKGMVRYLSLIDDMQEAKQPITSGEWSSAIYLAGRSLRMQSTDQYLAGRSLRTQSTDQVDAAIVIWRKMEQDAGVRGTHVTFNILFDIAVRAGKYALAESFLKEMYARGLRLNRLGRVSMMYYHGLRGDGDAVRRTYRDFVEAGEIVDTLVLNCVIASLLNAQEPDAAEQTYGRMKDLQDRLRTGQRADGSDTFYLRYPGGESSTIEREAASNSLGRLLNSAAHLRKVFPDHHADLQQLMPLRPDHVTFRAMVAYHANVSGDLDRITVLLKEMTEDFDLSIRPVMYQLLFKGFALHGKPKRAHARWNLARLHLTWHACRQALIDAKKERKAAAMARTDSYDDDEPTLPRLSEVRKDSAMRPVSVESNVERKKPGVWDSFTQSLSPAAAEPNPGIERVNSHLFDEEPRETPTGMIQNAFFPQQLEDSPPDFETKERHYYLGLDTAIDHEEGEYVLPSQVRTMSDLPLELPADKPVDNAELREDAEATMSDQSPLSDANKVQDAQIEEDDQLAHEHDENPRSNPDDYAEYVASLSFTASLPMVCWVLRAYTQVTASRAQVEEIYGSCRKHYRPKDPEEKEKVVRVLQRCLRHCDRYGHDDYVLSNTASDTIV
jgi:pentatricopeptide repeat protein